MALVIRWFRTPGVVQVLLALTLVLGQLLALPLVPAAGHPVLAAGSNHSLALNGTTAYADTPHTPALNLADSWTVETWFKDDSPTGFNHLPKVLLTKGAVAKLEELLK